MVTRCRRYTRTEGRRLDGVRMLDLLRLLRRRVEPGRATHARDRAEPGSRPSGDGRGRRTGASSTTVRRRTPRATRGRSARRYVWWDADGRVDRARRARLRRRRSRPTTGRRTTPAAADAISGDHPFIMQADGVGWLFVPSGLVDGPLPTHYEPQESPFANPLYAQQSNPRAQQFVRKREPLQPDDGDRRRRLPVRHDDLPAHRAPHRRRHDAHVGVPRGAAAGDVLRGRPELAAERGLEHGGWATIVSSRAAIEARVLVTDRMQPLQVQGARSTRSACRTTGEQRFDHGRLGQRPVPPRARPERAHPGGQGGDVRHRPGRRPRGPALTELRGELPRAR